MAQVGIIKEERLDNYIREAAHIANYEDSFGVTGCDQSQNHWWAAYTRQSTREQSENDRLGEYLLSLAKLAKQLEVTVPREYIIYDARSSEDLNRPGINWLRRELIAGRLISGIIVPFQGRLSADPLHQLTLERECDYYGVQLVCGDAPAGNDWASQTARLIQAQANSLRVKSNRDNILAGNIARVMTGKVPCHRAPYGYLLVTDKVIDQRTGRVRVNSALWQIDKLDANGSFILYSPAWVVHQIFIWVGEQGRTCYWVASELNKMKIPPPRRETWMPRTVINIVNRRCYTGKAEYNVNGRFPNPERPFGDPTMGVKRTLTRPKPEKDRVGYSVPALTSEELWSLANKNIKERGRGRGKQARSIPALLRNRILCPKCNKPMSVMRKEAGSDEVFYFCRAHYCPWIKNPCNYRKFIPASWDDNVWDDVCRLLRNDEWLEAQLGEEQNRLQDKDKLIQLEEDKIKQAKQKLSRIQDGWEKGVYTEAEAVARVKELRQLIANAEQEIENINATYKRENFNLDSLRQELLSLRSQNLEEASFEEKAELIARLGVKVIPAEDLKTRRICCRLNLSNAQKKGGENGLTKVTFGGPFWTRTRDPSLIRTVL
jgi:hypothetical protein